MQYGIGFALVLGLGIGVFLLTPMLTGRALPTMLGLLPLRQSAPVDFANLLKPDSPNAALVCPSQLCPQWSDPETRSAALESTLPAEQLLQRLLALVSQEPAVAVLREPEGLGGLKTILVQRTKLIGFPDIIDVEAVALADGRSSLMAFSRSIYGYSDLGVNQARLQRWMALLEADLAGRPPR
ncbi:MAG: DUF1499 domain-containing protein [Rhodospirillaceae bacterium]